MTTIQEIVSGKKTIYIIIIRAEADEYVEEYFTDSVSSSLSRVLTMTTYKKKNGSVTGAGSTTLYIYGNGLISEKLGDITRYHHYNNLGSTLKLTMQKRVLQMAKKKNKSKKMKEIQKVESSRDTFTRIVLHSTPLFFEYVVGLGSMLKYFAIFMAVMMVFVMGMLAIYILFGDGWKALWIFVVDFFTFWELEFVIQIIIMAMPFLCWWAFSKYMIKYHKTDCFVVLEDGVRLEKRDDSVWEISYPMLGECIRSKKIHIGPDWIKIPYGNRSIRLYSWDRNEVKELILKLGEKCDFPVPRYELLETLREYMVGWIISYQVGVPCILLGCYITIVGCMSEGGLRANELISTLLSSENFLGFVGVIIFFIGFLLKLVYYGSVRSYFKPYNDYFHVSL